MGSVRAEQSDWITLEATGIPVIIVGFRNAVDIQTCLSALTRANRAPAFSIFICENGGPAAFDSLTASLSAPGAPCAGSPEPVDEKTGNFSRVRRLRLGDGGPSVFLAEARENLGYAGGVNAWIKPLLLSPNWDALWVLNPDTAPEPDALSELVKYAGQHGKGMVGSRMMSMANPHVVKSRGLKWRKWMASPLGVDLGAPVTLKPNADAVDRRIDAPMGASIYVSRKCLDAIGLMDERFFLYYEDLDWGLRAKADWGVGYAYKSVVPTVGGTTIGSASRRGDRSRLSVYLDFRNRLIFVRKHYPSWFAWTVAITALRAWEFLAVGAIANFVSALRGVHAGLRGETGRPARVMASHKPPNLSAPKPLQLSNATNSDEASRES
jgi:N-acetylglucosaminyl-diphospho-decaprenol L-rhamnosyltransferase